jgi:hypothetical protein
MMNLGMSGAELLASATVMAPRRTFPVNGTAVLTDVELKESKSGYPTISLNFVSDIDPDQGINDYLRMSSARDLNKSINRIKYAFIYGGNEEALNAFAGIVQPIVAADLAGNLIEQPQWVTFDVEPTEDGKTGLPSDKIGEYLKACRESNENFDFIEMDVKDENGTLIGRKFCPAKIDDSKLEAFATAMESALSLLCDTTYYLQTRMSRDEKYQNISHIKAVK